LFFVDPETRAVVANEPDLDGVLQTNNGVYVGTLPRDVIVSSMDPRCSYPAGRNLPSPSIQAP
jgi:hypothetical protein